MRLKLVAVPVLLALVLAACNKKQKAQTIGEGSTPGHGASVAPSASAPPTAAPVATPTPPVKVAIDQTAQVIVYGYHRFVNQVRRPDTEITPQMFEQQMQELKNRGITVIGMQDFLAWKRGEKNIPPRCAIITFDDGWKSQYDVAWPIMKKFGYPFTLFIYTEGVRGGHFGGGEAITWEQLAEMRDAGIDIQAHSETHQDLRKPYDKVAKKKLSPPEYEQWLQNEVGRCKETARATAWHQGELFRGSLRILQSAHKRCGRTRAGYEAMFTVYGQPITFRSPMDSLGRYLIEGNKPKVFVGRHCNDRHFQWRRRRRSPQIGASNIASKPADGETIRNPLPLISANLSAFGAIDPGTVSMRVSGLGVVPASFDPKTNTVSYQVTQKLRDKCSVIVEAKSGGKKVEAHWTFAVEEGAPGASPSPKK